MKIDGIIFDSDGTLVDSETLSAGVIVGILQEHGVDISHSIILEKFRGGRFSEFASSLLNDFDVLGVSTFTALFRERSAEVFATDLKPMPGAVELLQSLNVEKCIASNGPRDKIEACLGATNLLPFFKGRIASAYDVGSWKPSPDLILHAAAMMDVPPSNCLLVDDSVAGVEAGIAANVRVVGYRLTPEMQSTLSQPVNVIEDLLSLGDIIR